MMIQINFEMKDISDFSIDALTKEKERIEKKIVNMEEMGEDDMSNYILIKNELEKRSE